MYEQPIHPKNLWLEHDPLTHEPVDEIYRANIGRLLERGTYTAPAVEHPGVHVPGGRYDRGAMGGDQALLGRLG